MELGKQIIDELIEKVLSSFFSKKIVKIKKKTEITYNLNYLLDMRPKSLQSPNMRRSYTSQPKN